MSNQTIFEVEIMLWLSLGCQNELMQTFQLLGVQPGFRFLPLGFGINRNDFLCIQLAKISFLLFNWFGFAWAKMWNFSLVQRSHFSLTGENGAPRSKISQVTVLSIP